MDLHTHRRSKCPDSLCVAHCTAQSDMHSITHRDFSAAGPLKPAKPTAQLDKAALLVGFHAAHILNTHTTKTQIAFVLLSPLQGG